MTSVILSPAEGRRISEKILHRRSRFRITIDVMSLKQQIISALKEALSELGITDVAPQLEIPQDYEHGDYSSNIAMVVAKRLKQNPMEVADEIVANFKFKISNLKFFDKIEVLRPGFINFWISQDFLGNYLDVMPSKKSPYTSIQVKNSRFEMYENTQPNTNKPLHIGHLRNTALGTAIVQIRKTLGHKVWSVNINNDRGIHIVKGMWGYLAFGKSGKFPAEQDLAPRDKFQISNFKFEKPQEDWRKILQGWIDDPKLWETPETAGMKADHFIGEFYVLGERGEKEFGDPVTLQLKEMLQAWEEADKDIRSLWRQMNGWFYQGFIQTHARFTEIDPEGPQFDKEWLESNVYEAGKQIVLNNLDKGLFHKREDGPVVADLAKYGLPDKVVVRSDGTSIYITQDIELARIRIQEEKADFTAYIVGNEQDLHFKQLFAICEELGIGKREQFFHISYGMVNLTGGVKMSSREGTAVIADELMDSVVEKVRSLFEAHDEKVTEQVALGAIKYWMLKYNPKAPITFDVNESVSVHGNSGPYLQYTFVRTQSVIAKAGPAARSSHRAPASPASPGARAGNPSLASPANMLPEELLLLRLLHRFPDVVEDAAEKFSPNLLCNYLFELAAQFNLFYQKYPILKSDQQAFRLSLTQGVGIVVKEGLQLLGIAAPSKM